MTTPEEEPKTPASEKGFKLDPRVLWLGVAAVVLTPLLILTFSLMGNSRPLTDSQAAKAELTSRVEKVFSQRFSIPTDSIIVDLGTEDPAVQLRDQRASTVSVSVAPNGDEAAALLAEIAGLQKNWVTVSGGYARIGAGFDVPFMGNVNVGVTQTVSASDGAVTLAPEGFYLSGLKVPASQLTEIPVVGEWVKQFTTAQSHCIVDRVPNGFDLTQMTVNGSTLAMDFTGENVSLALAELQKKDTCS